MYRSRTSSLHSSSLGPAPKPEQVAEHRARQFIEKLWKVTSEMSPVGEAQAVLVAEDALGRRL